MSQPLSLTGFQLAVLARIWASPDVKGADIEIPPHSSNGIYGAIRKLRMLGHIKQGSKADGGQYSVTAKGEKALRYHLEVIEAAGRPG